MELILSALKFLFVGFFGLIAALFLLALIFGKRIKKEWEFEAEFHDADGREFAEFDIEKSRIQKQEADYTVKPKLRLKHASLAPGRTVRAFVDDVLVLEGKVTSKGRVWFREDQVVNRPGNVAAGQVCRIEIEGGESFTAELRPD